MPPWQLAHVGLDNPLSYIPPRPLPIDTTLTASVPRCVLDPPPLRKSTRVSPHRPAVFDSDSHWWTFFSSSSDRRSSPTVPSPEVTGNEQTNPSLV